DSLSLPEAAILTHVCEIRRDEPDPGCAQVPRRRGHKEQRQELVVRSVEGRDEENRPPPHRGTDSNERLAIGESVYFQVADFTAGRAGEGVSKRLVAWKRKQQRG